MKNAVPFFHKEKNIYRIKHILLLRFSAMVFHFTKKKIKLVLFLCATFRSRQILTNFGMDKLFFLIVSSNNRSILK